MSDGFGHHKNKGTTQGSFHAFSYHEIIPGSKDTGLIQDAMENRWCKNPLFLLISLRTVSVNTGKVAKESIVGFPVWNNVNTVS